MERERSWCATKMQNLPQYSALGSAAFLFVSGGMHIAWSLGFTTIYTGLVVDTHVRICWFIAAIVGALASAVASRQIPYKFLALFCALIAIVGGIVCATTHLDLRAITAARYLNGLANGLIFPPTMALAGEITVNSKRGSVAATIEHLSYTIGIVVQVICSVGWSINNTFSEDQLLGVLTGVCGVLALVLGVFCTVESPVELLDRNEEQSALDTLVKLQLSRDTTVDTYEQLEGIRYYITYNEDLSVGTSWRQSLPALLRICFLRGLYAISFSAVVALGLQISSGSTYPFSSGPFVIFAFVRILGSFSIGAILDSGGRKFPLLFGLLVCGGFSFGIASQFKITGDPKAVMWLLLIGQFFFGLAFAPTSVFLSEAFPRAVKRPCIALAYTVELLVQLIVCCVTNDRLDSIAGYFYALGSFQLAAFLLCIKFVPETRQSSLQMAQRLFRSFLFIQTSVAKSRSLGMTNVGGNDW